MSQPPMQYPPPGYYPVYAYRPIDPMNSLATPAMVFGIIGLFIWPLSMAAVIMGHRSLDCIKNRGETGKGQALTGVILGWLVTGPWMVILIYFIVSAMLSG